MKHLVEFNKREDGRWLNSMSYSACGIYLHRNEETTDIEQVECGNCKRTHFYNDKVKEE